ncbi:MAG: T9SS type A sorting domain-containing protein, partial [Bacteroidales bacterium]
NNTIINNEAETGRQIHLKSGADLTLFNNIVWSEVDNVGTEIQMEPNEDAILNAIYNDIKGGWDGDGNLDADPMFMTGIYELSDSSRCIGSGTDSVEVDGIWYTAPILDFRGSVRPNPADNRVDLGAIESPFEWVDTTVTVKDLKPQRELRIYPNPSNDQIILHLNNAGKYEIKLISVSGQVVLSDIFSGNQRQIDLSGVAKGIYFIKVSSENFIAVQKFVKQ